MTKRRCYWAVAGLLGVAVWCATLIALATALGGCGGFSAFRMPWSSATPVVPPGGVIDPYAGLAWLGLACIGVGVVGFVAGFILPIIPKTTAGACILAGIGLFVLRAFLVKFMGPLIWLLGLVVLLFAAHATYRLWLNWKGSRLAAAGHFDAATALKSMARGWTGARHAPKRRELLAKVTNGHTEDHPPGP